MARQPDVDLFFPVSGKKRDPRYVQPAQRSLKPRYTEAEVQAFADKLRLKEREDYAEALAWAAANGYPIKGPTPQGGRFEIAYIDRDVPIYRVTCNAKSAKVNTVDQIRLKSPYWVNGQTWKVGVWEATNPQTDHPEFFTGDIPRVRYRDSVGSAEGDVHATHVIGTIAAAGLDPAAEGMAPVVWVDAYDWNNDFVELLFNGAAFPEDPGKLFVANHSYTFQPGWVFNRGKSEFTWGQTKFDPEEFLVFGGAQGVGEDFRFGFYNTKSFQLDESLQMRPYLLSVWAAGHERGLDGGPGIAQVIGFDAVFARPDGTVYRGGLTS